MRPAAKHCNRHNVSHRLDLEFTLGVLRRFWKTRHNPSFSPIAMAACKARAAPENRWTVAAYKRSYIKWPSPTSASHWPAGAPSITSSAYTFFLIEPGTA